MQSIREADVQTIELHARVFHYREGTNVYARAKLELPVGKVVSLKYVSQSQPFDLKGMSWANLVQNPDRDDFHQEMHGLNVPRKALEEVEEVLVNLDVPESNSKWVSLCYPIGDACRIVFPNMNPTNSALIVHAGFKRYHNDEALISNDSGIRIM